ncbi:MAG: Stp1/IreP family PP2C-type Ser/Thr phosphatase [Candidatus Acidiferrales bacterium]
MLEFGAKSDTGRVRANNEDSFKLDPQLKLFVLSDGMGGLEAGERASRLAVDTVVAHCQEAEASPALAEFGKHIEGVSDISNRLASAVRLANKEIFQLALELGKGGMGATVVAARFADDRVCIAHVGDSRVYLLRDGQFDQLTEDHSLVAEQVRRGMITPEAAGRSKMQNVLTRALGIDQNVDVDVSEEFVADGDTFLFCSDGLFRELAESEIGGVLEKSGDAQDAADRLVKLANDSGGQDNITVIVVRYETSEKGTLSKIGRWFKGSENPK